MPFVLKSLEPYLSLPFESLLRQTLHSCILDSSLFFKVVVVGVVSVACVAYICVASEVTNSSRSTFSSHVTLRFRDACTVASRASQM